MSDDAASHCLRAAALSHACGNRASPDRTVLQSSCIPCAALLPETVRGPHTGLPDTDLRIAGLPGASGSHENTRYGRVVGSTAPSTAGYEIPHSPDRPG